jgi:hypothetical protein
MKDIRTLEQVTYLDRRKQFLLDKILPKGKVCAMVGQHRGAISLLSQKIGFAIMLKQETFSGLKIKPKHNRVFYMFTGEAGRNGAHTLYRELMKKKPDVENLGSSYVHESEFQPGIEDVLKSIRADLIVVDQGLKLSGKNEMSHQKVSGFLRPFKQYAKKTGSCIVFIQRDRMKNFGSPISKISFKGKNGKIERSMISEL